MPFFNFCLWCLRFLCCYPLCFRFFSDFYSLTGREHRIEAPGMYECHPASLSAFPSLQKLLASYSISLFYFYFKKYPMNRIMLDITYCYFLNPSINLLASGHAWLIFISPLLFFCSWVEVHSMYGWACFLGFSINDMMVVVSIVSLNILIQIWFELKVSFLWDKQSGVQLLDPMAKNALRKKKWLEPSLATILQVHQLHICRPSCLPILTAFGSVNSFHSISSTSVIVFLKGLCWWPPSCVPLLSVHLLYETSPIIFQISSLTISVEFWELLSSIAEAFVRCVVWRFVTSFVNL